MSDQLTCIDLFCGCGGLSLGMEKAGFRTLAAIDSEPSSITVYRLNFPNVPHVLQRDLTKFRAEDLAHLTQTSTVDVVVGGPPCQGFSTVRQRDGANHGLRLVDDPRRLLYREFLAYVGHFRPKVFVMENVLGIRSAAGGEYFTRVQAEARALGYRVHGQVIKVADYGVPQKRQRQFIFGTRFDLAEYFREGFLESFKSKATVTLGEAIGDLPVIRAGGGAAEMDYDMNRRRAHVEKYGRNYLYKVLEVVQTKKLSAHKARPHSDRDLRDFRLLREGENCLHAMKRGVEFEFPYDKENFKDRYFRQHRKSLCSTIVAHLSKDGLMFIHPTQNRSLTPRETARIQSFPDWFQFPVTQTHKFRLIGNAVPPLVSKAVGLALRNYLQKATNRKISIRPRSKTLPADYQQATEWLMVLINAAGNGRLNRLNNDDFKRGWFSVGFLYPRLHPDSAIAHGKTLSCNVKDSLGIKTMERRLTVPFYVQSGWPLALEPVAREAWRRYHTGKLRDEEFYCSEAAISGTIYLDPSLADEAR